MEYLWLLMLFLFAVVVVGVMLLIARYIGPYRPYPQKLTTYECGVEPFGEARAPFQVKFFLIAIAFLIFDIEAVLTFPWAVKFLRFKYEGLAKFVFIEGFVFIAILFVGFLYLIGRKVFEWE